MSDAAHEGPSEQAVVPNLIGGTSRVAIADLLAVVRRGVESGTIKGERVVWCETHGCSQLLDESHRGGDYIEEHCAHGEWIVGEKPALDTWNCHIVERLVIPVSDGGSET